MYESLWMIKYKLELVSICSVEYEFQCSLFKKKTKISGKIHTSILDIDDPITLAKKK